MAEQERLPELVPPAVAPAEFVLQRPDDERAVLDAAREYYDRAVVDRPSYRLGAEVYLH